MSDYIDPGNKILQQCPYCDRIISGTGPLVRHMKSCKKKLCAQCKRPREKCLNGMKEWCCECGEKILAK